MPDRDIIERYSGLAHAALAGETIRDCGPDDFDQGCFGAAGYDDLVGPLSGAAEASLGCGNPLAVADLRAGGPCSTWALGAGSTCCCRPDGSDPMDGCTG